jgi:hypothetical protein
MPSENPETPNKILDNYTAFMRANVKKAILHWPNDASLEGEFSGQHQDFYSGGDPKRGKYFSWVKDQGSPKEIKGGLGITAAHFEQKGLRVEVVEEKKAA